MKFHPVPMVQTVNWSRLAELAKAVPEADRAPLPPTINAAACRASLRRFGLRIEPVKKAEKIVAWRICSVL